MGGRRPVSALGVRLAELVGALSLAVDLGLGQPMEHVARSCLLACRLGERIGAGEQERASLYYVALLGWVGCIADSADAAVLSRRLAGGSRSRTTGSRQGVR